jgi:hypothetical protein
MPGRIALATLILVAGCAREDGPAPPLSPAQRAAEGAAAARFLTEMAADVTREGPAAWARHFVPSQEFFMAADGALVFPDGDSAARGVASLAKTLTGIELSFGSEVKVDPLTQDLVALGAPYHEVLTDADGRRTESRGYFTALAEYRGGRWLLRDAHWSEPAARP